MTPEVRRGSASHRHWKLNWWDLWPLVDGESRPIQWTSNSLILSGDPSSPTVLARIFPSASSFALPSPHPVLNNPGGYLTPSLIEVSPCDEYIFASFEGKGNDSIGCIWHREETIDTWKVNIFWQIKPGQSLVLAKWLGEERHWLPTSPPMRAPPLGPSNPFGTTTLLLVNQSHTVQIVHRPASSFPFQLISASLRHASQANAGERPVMGETTNGAGGLSVCAKAAVGLGYDEGSIIVATTSKLIPPASASSPDFSSFGVSAPSTPPTIPPSHSPWENYGTEHAIHLCEVNLTALGFLLGVSTNPLPPLFPSASASSHLTSITFVPCLPTVASPSSPEGSVVDNGSPSSKEETSTTLHIVLAYLDFEDYSSPRSALISFELKRKKAASEESIESVGWAHRYITTRTVTASAVSFVLPSRTTGLILAGLLDFEGVAPRSVNVKGQGKIKEAGLGKIVMLKVPQLENDEDWEPSRLMAGADDVDVDPPISAAVSPAGSLICTSTATWSGVSKVGVHTHPRPRNSLDLSSVAYMAESLLSALLSNRPPTDIVHSFINSTVPISLATQVLEHTHRALDCDTFATQDWSSVIIGLLLEIFRTRSKRMSEDNLAESRDKASLDERWHVALDMCSVKAVGRALEACQDDDGYDLEHVWQLIGLATWLVNFAERLVRICVLWEGDIVLHGEKPSSETSQNMDASVKVKMEAMETDGDDLFNGELSPAPETSGRVANPQLLHIFHPYALNNLIGALSHLNAFRAYLDTLNASGVKSGIAKDVVVDVIDCSGLNLKELEAGLRKANTELELAGIDAEVFRRCLCSLSLFPSMHDQLVKACRLVTSPRATSKPRLFVKPSDLVDGISKLNMTATRMSQECDVISKGVLGAPGNARTCARCKGKTETGQMPLPRGKEMSDFGRWAVWEHEWEKCICGGLWIRERTR